jgi:hypothetical protein
VLICRFNPTTMRCIWPPEPDVQIKVAFRYGERRFLSRLICWWRGGDSAHCEVAVGEVGQPMRCITASWLDGGVRHKIMPLPPDKWRIYTVTAEVEPFSWFDQHEGEKYDFLGLLSFVVSVIRHRKRGWFCSEAAAHIIGLPAAHRFDLVLLEAVCARYGNRIQ